MPRRKASGKRIKMMRRGRLFCGGSGSFAGFILEPWCLGLKHGCVLKEGRRKSLSEARWHGELAMSHMVDLHTSHVAFVGLSKASTTKMRDDEPENVHGENIAANDIDLLKYFSSPKPSKHHMRYTALVNFQQMHKETSLKARCAKEPKPA